MQEVNGVVNEQIYDGGEGTLPEGIKIIQNGNTYCLVADKDFSQGEFILDTKQCMHVPKQLNKIKIKINGIEYICTKQHTIQYQNYRYFGKFLSFINHACNPNTIFFLNKTRLNQLGYQLQECFSTRNIKKGEQLNCNYLYFYYDGEEQEQFVCGCGFQRCYKQIKGFKYLSLQDKVNLLPILSIEVRQIWLKQQSNIKIIEQQQLLNKLSLDKNNCYLTASKQLTIGQIVFDYKPLQIDQNSIIIIKKHDKYQKMELSQLNSMISNNRLEYVKLYTKRSTSPNIQTIQKGQNKVGLCVRKIQVGQVLVEGQNQLDADLLDFGLIQMPNGVDIGRNQKGLCLLATQDFKNGQTLFENQLIYVPEYVNKYKFRTDKQQYQGDQTNSVKQGTQRIIYLFGGFMNHSCSQNTISIDDKSNGKNYQVACKEIKAGQQLTCNYFHYDYDCDGHQFKCSCNSEGCFGQIKGFKNISYNEQLKLLPKVSSEIKRLFQKHRKLIHQLENGNGNTIN